MDVFVLVCDIGLGGVVVHGVYSQPPPKEAVDKAAAECHSYTGYTDTDVVHGVPFDPPLEAARS